MNKLLRRWISVCESVLSDDLPPDPEGMMEAFDEALDKLGLADRVTVSLMPDPDSPQDTVELNHISVKAGHRGGGLATQAMALLTDFADQFNVVLRLGVATDADGRDGGLTTDQLIEWYTGWGFEGGQVMRRSPDTPR